VQVHKPFYAPDSDTSWSKTPGALYGMTGFVPLQRGVYGTVAKSTIFAGPPADTDILFAKTFRQTSGAVRLLVFTPNDIDEYSNAGSKTNRATGLTTTADWNAVAWGDRIIAVSITNAPQTSTGAGFSALAGSPPKAAHVAASELFVMLANLDDGTGTVTPDEVWWSDISNPTSWSVSEVGTEAGRRQLLGTPGPITALVSYRDTFVAFKGDSIYVGEHVGPPFTFAWRMISHRVGCVATHSVVELDNKLYFTHTTGVWEYDGASLRNVSLPVFQSVLQEMGRIDVFSGSEVQPPGGQMEPVSITKARACGDDIEGVLLLMVYQRVLLSGDHVSYLYAYNVRTQAWSRIGPTDVSSSTTPGLFVDATTADTFDFTTVDVRSLVLPNNATMYGLTYPGAADTDWVVPTFAAGNFGTIAGHSLTLRAYAENLPGSGQTPFSGCEMQGYKDSARNDADPTAVAADFNSSLYTFDGRLSSRFATVEWTVADGETVLLAGIGVGDVIR
jgi:hypothetical protein